MRNEAFVFSTEYLQSRHLEDGTVHLVHLSVFIQQAVGAAAQAAVQGGGRDRGVAGSVARPSCAEKQPHPSRQRDRKKRMHLCRIQESKKLRAKKH